MARGVPQGSGLGPGCTSRFRFRVWERWAGLSASKSELESGSSTY